MSLTTFKIGKKEFVVIPRKRHDELSRVEEGRRDAEIVRKGRKAFLAGKMKTVPLEEARRKNREAARLSRYQSASQGTIYLFGEDAYRVSLGDYRIIYSIHDDRLIMLVINIATVAKSIVGGNASRRLQICYQRSWTWDRMSRS